jgi:hypothetical protein
MNQELIKQRIAYLVEHGGIHRDPVQDLERVTQRTLAVCTLSCLVLVLEAGLLAWRYYG